MTRKQTNAHTRGCVRTLICVCVVCVATAAAVEFDTTGHPLKQELPESTKKRILIRVKSSFQRDSAQLSKYGIQDVSQLDDLAICGVMKRYKVKYTKDTLTKQTPVSSFVTYRDTGLSVFVCLNRRIVAEVQMAKAFYPEYRWSTIKPFSMPENNGVDSNYTLKDIFGKVVKRWHPSKGYHPVYILAPGPDCFHVPEVDSFNLTPMPGARNKAEFEKLDFSKLEYTRKHLNKTEARKRLKREITYRQWAKEKFRKDSAENASIKRGGKDAKK